jgi:hypothetical protein
MIPMVARSHAPGMKRGILVVMFAAMLVSACGAAATPTAHRQSPSPAPSAATSSGALACRLPVAGFVISAPKGQPDSSIAADGMDNQKGTGGFLELPSGKFTPAKDSDRTYLASAHKWLPVTRQAVSPDERTYVQARPSGSPPTVTLYLVEVGTGASRRLFTAPAGDFAIVLGFTATGIYVETLSSTNPGAPSAELVVIDPSSGASHAVAGSQTPPGVIQSVFTAITGGFAWGTVIAGSQQQPSYQLVRLDLTAGTTVVWSHTATPDLAIGFDADGHPIVNGTRIPSAGSQSSLTLLSAPNQSTPISIKGGNFLQGRGTPVNDAHGTWFGSADGGIWLYSPAGGMEKVASVPPQPGGSGEAYDQHGWRSVAGPCV